MRINHQTVGGAPTPSASVMVLRDGAQGLQVLLAKRHSNSKVLGGVYVFPGGKLDPQDCAVDPNQLDRPPQALQHSLAEDGLEASTAAGLYVAALRETFEECGLLLHDGHAPDLPQRVRTQLQQGQSFVQAAAAVGLGLHTRRIHPWSRWITPRMPSVMDRRFDTRFFVALAPSDHEALHDAHEVTETVWLTPAQAITAYWEGRMGLAPVQIITLMQIARLGHSQAVLAHAQSRAPMRVEPEPFDEEGQRVICYPGDARHPQPDRLWEGPTRLTWRNNRFEPEGGLQALLP